MLRSYNREWLQKADFDPLEFIQVTKNTGLPDLTSQLHHHLQQVQTEIGQCVNAEFEDFVRVYRECGQVGEAEFEALETPLEQLHHRLNRLHARLAGHLQGWEEIVGRWDRLENERRELVRLQEICQHLDDLEAIHQRDRVSSRLVEVAAVKYARTKELLLDTTPSLLVSGLLTRLGGQAEQLAALLEQAVVRAIQEPADREGWLCLGRAFGLLERTQDLEALVKQRVTLPFCSRFLQPGQPFAEQVDLILTFAKGALDQLTRPLHPQYPQLTVNAVLAPLLQGILSRLPGIFSPGQPDAFHLHYTLAMQLLRDLMVLEPTLSRYPVCIEFMRSWQTNVYYQIRCKEILNQTTVGKEQFLRCWSPSVLLDPVLTKFFHLTLQLVMRVTQVELAKDLTAALAQIKQLADLADWLKETLLPHHIQPVLQAKLPKHCEQLSALFLTHGPSKLLEQQTIRQQELLDRLVETAKQRIQLLDLAQPDYAPGSFLQEFNLLKDKFIDLKPARETITKYYREFAEGKLKAAQKAAANHRRLVAVLSGEERVKAEQDQSKEAEVQAIEQAMAKDLSLLNQ